MAHKGPEVPIGQAFRSKYKEEIRQEDGEMKKQLVRGDLQQWKTEVQAVADQVLRPVNVTSHIMKT